MSPDPALFARIGTAGWSIPRQYAGHFSGQESNLVRYSRVFRCAEINSSFYRPHRPSTYARWAASTPEAFRFSVKMRKTVTHECGLAPATEQLRSFFDEVRHLGEKLGPILLQLPPKQAFQKEIARNFFARIRDAQPDGAAVLEPRHASWFADDAEELLKDFRIARVIADPPPAPEASVPAGDSSLIYYRLHGSPRVYYSSYPAAWLDELARDICANKQAAETWCIFDNTASGAAAENALALQGMVDRRGS